MRHSFAVLARKTKDEASGSPAFSTRGYLRWGNAHRGGRSAVSDFRSSGTVLRFNAPRS